MVRCDRIDGEPCKCELEEPCVKYMVQTIISNLIKFVLGTITHGERDELREFVRMPDAGKYLSLYVEEMDKERELLGNVVLERI